VVAKIPILDLTRQYAAIKGEIDRAVLDVLAAGVYINGPNVRALEDEIADYVGTQHAVALNSGTDALHLALRALGIGPGDEVITTPFTFVATTEAIGMVGATPVFADIDPRTFNLDPRSIERAVTPRTRAILPVHLYGLMSGMDEVLAIAGRHGLPVVEDCAQAIGAHWDGRPAGSLGTIGCFSFFPSKNLGAYGDGGMLVTGDARIAARVRSLRAHGGAVKYHHDELGVNSRLDEIQAAILRVKLRRLDEWIDARRAIAARYTTSLGELSQLETPYAPSRHVFHQYTVRVRERDAVARALERSGIQTMVYYPVPLHLQAVHASLGYGAGDFPQSERAANEVLSLPMFPELEDVEVDRAIAELRAVVESPVALGDRV
jgi:dTDP-4-amino-4,6-dideoxygalactose transaminase